MTVHRKAIPAKVEMVGERQVRVICSTESIDRSGEIVVQAGIDLENYRSNPIVLWQHNVDVPIGRSAEIGLNGGNLVALVDFAPAGVSAKADEICGLVKAGVVNAVSIGFTPLETEPLDKNNPKKGPQKYLRSELCELSYVSVPANSGALVIERQYGPKSNELKVGASRNLDIDTDDGWAEFNPADSIFAKAAFDGEDRDTTFARKGFLAYDPSASEERDAYLVPFARVKGGRLVTSAAGLLHAAAELAKLELPADVATKARAVLDHYEAKMKNKSASPEIRKDVSPLKVKGLYDVAQAAYALSSLGYLQQGAAWEAEVEGDGSKVPAMIAEACRALADALVAMTQEEVAELLATMLPAETENVAKSLVAKGVLKVGAKPLQIALAVAGLMSKSGRKFSAATEKSMREACKSIADGHEMIKSGHDSIMGMLDDDTDDADDEDGDGDEDEDTSDTDDDEAKAARQVRVRELELLTLSAA